MDIVTILFILASISLARYLIGGVVNVIRLNRLERQGHNVSEIEGFMQMHNSKGCFLSLVPFLILGAILLVR